MPAYRQYKTDNNYQNFETVLESSSKLTLKNSSGNCCISTTPQRNNSIMSADRNQNPPIILVRFLLSFGAILNKSDIIKFWEFCQTNYVLAGMHKRMAPALITTATTYRVDATGYAHSPPRSWTTLVSVPGALPLPICRDDARSQIPSGRTLRRRSESRRPAWNINSS